MNNFNNSGPQDQDMRAYLKGDTIIEGRSIISFEFKHSRNATSLDATTREPSAYIELKGHTIYPKDTDSIQVGLLTGIPKDNVWLFAIKKGKITVFSDEAGMENENLNFFQKQNDSMTTYTYDNLKAAVSDNPQALAKLESYRSNKIATYSMIGGGIIFLIASLTQVKGDEPPTSFKVCIGSGLGLLLGAWIPQYKGKLLESIEIYNRN